jgi:hypothetical protein
MRHRTPLSVWSKSKRKRKVKNDDLMSLITGFFSLASFFFKMSKRN